MSPKVTPVGAALLMLCACGAPPPVDAPPAAPETPPPPPPRAASVILITIDTLRADMLSVTGGPARTPVLDGLAKAGWWFAEAYSASMLTNPSHASIMTSLYPRDHGVYDNESGIADGVPTLASAMRAQGKRTAAVINFPHLNPHVSNLGQGFQKVIEAERKERRAPEMSALALSTIDELQAQSGDAGWFLWLHYTDPHAPYEPPASHPPAPVGTSEVTPISKAVRSAPGFQRRNAWFQRAFKQHDSVEELTNKYIAEVEATDAGLGVLIRGLQERGLHDDIAYVITSDHGESLGEHGLYFHHGGLYRQTVQVPLIVKAPGLSGGRQEALVSTLDVAPTILALTDTPAWQPMRGESLLGLTKQGRAWREHVYSEHMLAQQVAVRTKDSTLIRHRKTSAQFPSYPLRTGVEELYDRAVDPQEIFTRPMETDASQELQGALDRYLGLGLRLSARPAVGQDRESLRALGYIE